MEGEISLTREGRFEIEAASWRDLNALRHLEEACFPQDAWPLWDLISVLTLPGVVRLKATLEGRMVGFIAGDRRDAQGIAWIVTVGVLPDYRHKGIGEALIRACEERLGKVIIRLSVRASNEEAVRLYRRLGYRWFGTWTRYYSDGEDAVVMEKSIEA
jgi:ribosomal protein S18 acetylase RimI-like enzyme